MLYWCVLVWFNIISVVHLFVVEKSTLSSLSKHNQRFLKYINKYKNKNNNNGNDIDMNDFVKDLLLARFI